MKTKNTTNKDISKLGLSGKRKVAGEWVEWNPLGYLVAEVSKNEG